MKKKEKELYDTHIHITVKTIGKDTGLVKSEKVTHKVLDGDGDIAKFTFQVGVGKA